MPKMFNAALAMLWGYSESKYKTLKVVRLPTRVRVYKKGMQMKLWPQAFLHDNENKQHF